VAFPYQLCQSDLMPDVVAFRAESATVVVASTETADVGPGKAAMDRTSSSTSPVRQARSFFIVVWCRVLSCCVVCSVVWSSSSN
jgi:hypothetical protein